jgi:nucleolar protein 9
MLMGLMTDEFLETNPDNPIIHSDYLSTLLRDPTASHLLETLVSRSPPSAFEVLRHTYFMGKLSRLSAHPVANFVVAKVVDRADATQIGEIIDEMEGAWTKVVGGSVLFSRRPEQLFTLVRSLKNWRTQITD